MNKTARSGLIVWLVAVLCTLCVVPGRALAEPEGDEAMEAYESTEITEDEGIPQDEDAGDLEAAGAPAAEDTEPVVEADQSTPADVEEAAGVQADVVTLPDGAGANGITVSVTQSSVIVRVSGVGASGTASLCMCNANEYQAADALHGVSTKTSVAGTTIGTYTCGSTQEFTISRYDAAGNDNLYKKFYLMQGSSILAGPVYATSIASVGDVGPFPTITKKGLIHEDGASPAMIQEMGASNTVINMDIGSLIYANEDKNGNPIDNSRRSDVIEFESNGETFYFNGAAVRGSDSEISQYSKMGVNVTLVVIAWYNTDFGTYPTSLAYVTSGNHQTLAFNTSNERGLRYWVAAMEFLADRYSRDSSHGLVDKFIIGNEVDYTFDWYLITPEKDASGKYQCAPLDTFMEEYSRTVRLANLAVKKYNAGAKVTLSLTHNWVAARKDSVKTGALPNTNRLYNSYAPKAMLDWMNTVEKSRGDYDWSISVHPYPVGTTPSNPHVTDFNPPSNLKPITGDWRTTPWITCSNLELYQQYLERPEARYNGEIREVSLTETSICTLAKGNVSESAYALSLRQQAASIALYYYRAANLSCITEIAYFKAHDIASNSYKLGLMEVDDTKKPSYDVWKYVDTNLSFDYANKYLGSVSNTVTSYRDLMDASHSGFDWNSAWSESNIMRRTVSESNDDVFRLAGNARYDTSIKIADQLRRELGVKKFDTIVVACGTNFADALGGSYLATKKGAPILLVDTKQPAVVKKVQAYINDNLNANGTVYVLGGKFAVAESFDKGIKGAKRVQGADRYGTNLAVLAEAGVNGGDILVATGTGYADTLSASASGRPILMVGKSLNSAQQTFIKNNKAGTFYIIGGPFAVSASVEQSVNSLTGKKATRVAGTNRFGTSIEVSKRFFGRPTQAVVAYGMNFPDALCGGPLAATVSAPMILTTADAGNLQLAVNYCSGNGIKSGYVLGGPGAGKLVMITDDAAKKVFGSVPMAA